MRPLLVVSLLCALAIAFPARAQEGVLVFYLGREDTTGDGQINTLDTVGIFAALADGQNLRLSPPEQQVYSYRANAANDTIAFITVDDAQSIVLHIATLNGVRASYPLDDARFALVEDFGAQVWISGQNEGGENFVAGYVPETGAETRALLQGEDVVISFSPAETALLAYSAGQGRIMLASLPDLTQTQPALPARLLGAPAWSPAGDAFAVVAADDASGGALALHIITSNGDSRALPLPSIASPQLAFLGWSSTGRFVTLKLEDSAQTPTVTQPLHVIDLAQGAISTLGDGSAYVEAIEWSSDDSALLLSANTPGDEAALDYLLYDSASGQSRILETLSLARPTFFAWQPQTTQVWTLGAPFSAEQSGISAFDIRGDALSVLMTRSGTSLLGGALIWSSAGDSLIVLETVQDPIAQLMGVSYSLSRYDEGTAALIPLSSSTVSPLPFGIQVP